MMRLIVCAAELVCSVANVRCPVSAMRSADSIVSRSRSSPMRTMSGSSRSAARRAPREPVRVAVHLALIDQAALVLVDVLDRILDRQDVLAAFGVDLVDHRGERGRLAAAGRSGHEHQAARPIGKRGENRRQPELVEALDRFGDDPIDGGNRAALVEDVAAEAREAADAEREVELQRFLEALLLRVGEHAVGEPLRLGRAESRQVERLQLAVDADLRRRARRQMQVGPAQFDERLQQFR